MIQKISLLILSIMFFLVYFQYNIASASTLDISDETLKKMDDYVKEQFKSAGIVGGSYAIVSKDQLVSAKGVGYSNLKSKIAAKAETIYPIASLTKSLTATAILQLQEQGKLDINDPVQKYLPWFTYKDEEESKDVTIQHLLTHSAGVNRFQADGAIFIDEKKNRNSIEDSIRALRTVDMTSDPGNTGQYCNSCYNTLGLIIEKITGESYYDYMKNSVFMPLSMNSTVYGQDLQSLHTSNVAQEYSWFFGFRNTKLLNYQVFGKSQDPEGGIYTNVLDLTKYVSATLGHSSSPLLSTTTLQMSYKGVVNTEDGSWKYTNGGFEEGKVSGHQVLYKGGDGVGSSSAMMLMPDKNLGVILFIGEANSEPKQDIVKGMLHILLGEEPQTSEFPPPLFKVIGSIMLSITICSIFFICLLGRLMYKRITGKNKLIKHRWLSIFLSIFLLGLFCLIGYLLLFIRPTQIGFYGYLYDWAIGLISLEITLFVAFIYNIYLSIYGIKKSKDEE